MLEYVMEYTNCVLNHMIYYLLECFVYCAIYMSHYEYQLLQFWDLPFIQKLWQNAMVAFKVQKFFKTCHKCGHPMDCGNCVVQ